MHSGYPILYLLTCTFLWPTKYTLDAFLRDNTTCHFDPNAPLTMKFGFKPPLRREGQFQWNGFFSGIGIGY
ncbi:hypothetical protein FB45DRAFT_895618 [Roridomyces roridus]|uniref:Uncharacterized protein n=1 Tax=Roridomyces roridus TaxID=1738132 RepID=A0AAD7CC34_9AGAR|nr:hypothetical protein FB45DRAFT_895618 [Roridomyces roridus]